MLTENDKNLLTKKDIAEKTILDQLKRFKTGFPYAHLTAPAILDHGIISWDEIELRGLVDFFLENKEYYSLAKFVPASGAASRMFKDLFSFIEQYKGKATPDDLLSRNDSTAFFFSNIRRFAFFDELCQAALENGMDLETLIKEQRYVEIAELLLLPHGLNYGSLPKGLLSFHTYDNESRKAIEEHFIEGAIYAANNDNIVKLHFTVSPEHLEHFEQTIDSIKGRYEQRFNVRFEVQYSIQKPSTDTIAADLNNDIFRDKDGNMLFRPGGHGALIENLNDLQEEIVFIKNIDNVVHERLINTTSEYKQALAGYLIKLQQINFEYLNLLNDGFLDDDELDEIMTFAKEKLFIDIPEYVEEYAEMEKIDYLYDKLNRPMRVCGVVKNEGEPGGGPYWMKNINDEISLQIVESSQINHDNERQESIFRSATHFNPVDLVCGCWDYNGKPFDLREYIDHNTGFISHKSKDGKELKALELPGLWNGAMADWITIFVEVPSITFNPVKTVNDLLKENHQA